MTNPDEINTTLITALLSGLTGLATFCAWLVKKIFDMQKDYITAISELKAVVANNNELIKEHLQKEKS